MKLEKEDYIEPNCVLCGKPGEEVGAEPVPVGRILDKLREYEDRSDWEAVERHLKYWLAEAEANHDERGQLMLNNELMGYYRKQGRQEEAFAHAEEMFRKAIAVMKQQEYGELEQAITWLNMADAAEAALGAEAAEEKVGDYLDTAEELLDTESLPRNGYYAFVCEKCAPVFGHYGYFATEAELMRRAKEIHDGD